MTTSGRLGSGRRLVLSTDKFDGIGRGKGAVSLSAFLGSLVSYIFKSCSLFTFPSTQRNLHCSTLDPLSNLNLHFWTKKGAFMRWCPQCETAVMCMRPKKEEEAVYGYHCWSGVVFPWERRLAHHVDGAS